MSASKAAATQPIIVIKRKGGGHGGHHGGAWKVAYADFVTAMMSLFIVLWLMSASEKVKKAVAGYFNDPKGVGSQLGTSMTGTGKGEGVVTVTNSNIEKLKEKLELEIKAKKELKDISKQIEITVTSEGLRIELIEGKDGTFYELGSAKLSPGGQALLALLGTELKSFSNSILIEGHTDSTPYASASGYSNWELSADRANAARRLLQQDGVRTDQVMQVRGYADQMLRVKSNPTDPSNRRISILVTNDDYTVQTVSADKVVSGNSPLPTPEKSAASASQAKAPIPVSTPESKSGAKPAPVSTATPMPAPATPPKPTSAPTKTASPAKPAAATPPAKPGWMDKLKSAIPGAKKR